MKKIILITISCLLITCIVMAGYAIAGASKSDIYICTIQKTYEHKDHNDGKCDICGTTLWDPVKGSGCADYEWCNKCARKVMDTAKGL